MCEALQQSEAEEEEDDWRVAALQQRQSTMPWQWRRSRYQHRRHQLDYQAPFLARVVRGVCVFLAGLK